MKPIFIELTQHGTGKQILVNPCQVEMIREEDVESLKRVLYLSISGEPYIFAESKAQLLQMIDRAYQEGGEK